MSSVFSHYVISWEKGKYRVHCIGGVPLEHICKCVAQSIIDLLAKSPIPGISKILLEKSDKAPEPDTLCLDFKNPNEALKELAEACMEGGQPIWTAKTIERKELAMYPHLAKRTYFALCGDRVEMIGDAKKIEQFLTNNISTRYDLARSIA